MCVITNADLNPKSCRGHEDKSRLQQQQSSDWESSRAVGSSHLSGAGCHLNDSLSVLKVNRAAQEAGRGGHHSNQIYYDWYLLYLSCIYSLTTNQSV